MDILSKNEKLLYDSCEDFAKMYIGMIMYKHKMVNLQMLYPFFPNGLCLGDDNIIELCNRCPFYTPLFTGEDETNA